MPLDSNVQMVLDQLAAAGAPPITEQSVEQVRTMFDSMTMLVGEPEPVGEVINRTIPGPAGDIPVRVYRPAEADPGAALPVLIWYHGGGWVIGSVDTTDGQCRALANRAGCVVVSVEYRLAPEHRFPAAADDALAAAQWVAVYASDIGGDSKRIAVGGDSAGGNLAAVVCLMARDKGGPVLAFQLLVYPVCDFNFDTVSYRDNADGYLLTRASMEWFWAHYLADADGSVPYASPLRADDFTGLPPALVVTAEFDPLRDEGEAYAARLQAAGVATAVSRFDGMIHGFFGMGLILPQAKQAIEDAGAALRDAFARP